MNICIFCSAYEVDDKYVQAAKQLATLLAKAGHHLVFGGSDSGLMGVTAAAFRRHGGKIYGISIDVYKHNALKSADEMIIAKDLGARKAAMLAKSDVLITLPGGIGTLDELTEVIELKKQKHHRKAIIILNAYGFYDGFKEQLDRISREGFSPEPLNDLISYCQTPEEVQAVLSLLGDNETKSTAA